MNYESKYKEYTGEIVFGTMCIATKVVRLIVDGKVKEAVSADSYSRMDKYTDEQLIAALIEKIENAILLDEEDGVELHLA